MIINKIKFLSVYLYLNKKFQNRFNNNGRKYVTCKAALKPGITQVDNNKNKLYTDID